MAPPPEPAPPPPPAPEPPPDPTGPIVQRIAAQIAEERARAQAADQKVLAREKVIASANAEVERLNRQEAQLKTRASDVVRYAEMLEREADLLARHRDVLAQKRDQEVQRVRKTSGPIKRRLRRLALPRRERHLATADRDRVPQRHRQASARRPHVQHARTL